MKITGINIGEYRQFKNINFDFTYPQEHPTKKGQPLEKVCFIGQSGTGKTTLLNVIWEFFTLLADADLVKHNHKMSYNNFSPFDAFDHEIKLLTANKSVNKHFIGKDFKGKSNRIASRVGHTIKWVEENGLTELINSTDKLCLFIKDSISREADAFLFDQKTQPQTFSDFVKTDTQIEKEKVAYNERIDAAGAKKVIALGDMQSLSTWQYLLKEITEYDESTVNQVTKIIQTTPKALVTEELQKWLTADPRIELAEKCLNPILSKFFLEINTDVKGNAPIALRTKQGINIDSSNLSTGTRQLLATAIPIYKFDTTDTAILFDEPERSLFPDIQRELVKYYTSLAPKAQFFFATHSPIIASAFEPCERFILYFDENGEVKYHRGIAPEGDDPNDILRQDFGMSPLMLDKGVEEYQRYLDLETKILKEKDRDRKMELIAERSIIGNKYNFPVTTTNETN